MKTVKVSGTPLTVVLILAVIAYLVLRKRQGNNWIFELAKSAGDVPEEKFEE